MHGEPLENCYTVYEKFPPFSIHTEKTELWAVNKTSVNLHKYFQWKMYINSWFLRLWVKAIQIRYFLEYTFKLDSIFLQIAQNFI